MTKKKKEKKIKEVKNNFKFESGKYYHFVGSGTIVHVFNEYENIHFGKCFITETNKSVDFIPLGNHEGATKGWVEIAKSEWDKTFKDWPLPEKQDDDGVFDTAKHSKKNRFQKDKYYRHSMSDYDIHIIDKVFAAMYNDCFIAETNKDPNSFLSMSAEPGAARDWFEISKEYWLENFDILNTEEKSSIWTPEQKIWTPGKISIVKH